MLSNALSVQLWPVARLKPCPRNPRTHGARQIEKIAESIRTFGFTNPVLVDPAGEIIAGEARWKAAKQAGMTEVPVIVLGWLTEQERTAYRIADNRLALDAAWNEELLAEVMNELSANGFALEAIGFSDDEITAMIETALAPAPDDIDRVDPPPVVPVTKLGDIWTLGPHRLICGDATDEGVLARLFGGDRGKARTAILDTETADLIVTDPPYGMAYKGKTHGGIKGDDQKGADLIRLVSGALTAGRRHSKPEGSVYVWLTWRTYGEFAAALKEAELSPAACLVWDKGHIGPGSAHYRPQHEFCLYCPGTRWFGGRSEPDIWRFNRDPASTYVHPTQKPVDLMERAVRNSSRKGEIVLDLFGGSGSTLIACERLGRQARLVELDPKYCDAIVARWERLTGARALRVEAEDAEPDDLDGRGGEAGAEQVDRLPAA